VYACMCIHIEVRRGRYGVAKAGLLVVVSGWAWTRKGGQGEGRDSREDAGMHPNHKSTTLITILVMGCMHHDRDTTP